MRVIGPLAYLASVLVTLADPRGIALVPRELEFPFDDARRLNAGEVRAGKVWRSRRLPSDGSAVPLVVFVHGIIFDGLRHHWLTRDPAGPWDAHPFLEDLVATGHVAPLVAAVPSQTRDATDPGKLFPELDFDAFVDAVDATLAPLQRVDRTRIVVFGHSAAACDPASGAFAVTRAKSFTVRALIAVDGCMLPSSARFLATMQSAREVIVTYQDVGWPERPFDGFRAAWTSSLAPGTRVLERREPKSENPHLALVEETARRVLPRVLPP